MLICWGFDKMGCLNLNLSFWIEGSSGLARGFLIIFQARRTVSGQLDQVEGLTALDIRKQYKSNCLIKFG